MTQPKLPKHLPKRYLLRTGYGYITKDHLYRIFRYKTRWSYTWYHEPQRWMLLHPDSTQEFFNTLLEIRERLYELQQKSEIKKEEDKLKKEYKERKKERKKK